MIFIHSLPLFNCRFISELEDDLIDVLKCYFCVKNPNKSILTRAKLKKKNAEHSEIFNVLAKN
jgi:hypothetical protein